MADKVGDEFDGYITGVSAFGLYIELVEHFVEGMVHISTMADDYYRFVEKAHVLKGENTGKVYRLGDRVTVQVVKVDMERRQIDLGLVEHPRTGARIGREPRPAPQQGGAAASGGAQQQAAEAARAPGRSAPGARSEPRNGSDEPSARWSSARRVTSITARARWCARSTGTDPDRLKEEQARGITIDLGFAHARRRRHQPVVRGRAGSRAVRQEHARRRRRHRPGDAGRRRRRVGDAADARALRHLPAAARARRPDRAHQDRHRRRRSPDPGRARSARADGRVLSRGRARSSASRPAPARASMRCAPRSSTPPAARRFAARSGPCGCRSIACSRHAASARW